MLLTRVLAGRPSGPGTARTHGTAAVLLVALLPALLGGCEPSRSFERGLDGNVTYLDQLDDAQKATVRDEITRTLLRGLDRYALRIGDEFEVFFHLLRRPAGQYVIHVADKLRVEFLNDPAAGRTVPVRPDGRISLPLVGAVVAAGRTSEQLSRELERRYTGLVPNPQITISESEIHTAVEDFVDMIGPNRSRSITGRVLPDGTVVMPRLKPLAARGRTVQELQDAIDAAYAKAGLDIGVSVVPHNLQAGAALVFGEVPKPGRIDSDRPQTVLMTVAQAGGVLATGSMEQVRVFYIGEDSQPHLRVINLANVIDGLSIEQDMIVPPNAVIYVPPTGLTRTGRFLDQVLRDILRFQGFGFTGSYIFNNQSSGTVVVPSK